MKKNIITSRIIVAGFLFSSTFKCQIQFVISNYCCSYDVEKQS